MAAQARRFSLSSTYDVVTARQFARQMARELGFGLTDQARIATAVSEVSQRALDNQGVISFAVVMDPPRRGIECICHGCEWLETPPDTPTGEVLGGMRGIERLMDEFIVDPDDSGVVVIMRKWLRQGNL